MEKHKLLAMIKELIKTNKDDNIEINENYLQYFDDEELINIINKLKEKKNNILNDNIDNIYEKNKEI